MPEVETAEPLGEDVCVAVLRDCLSQFPEIRLRVRGGCMEPQLSPGETVLIVAPGHRRPRFGDVVLARTAAGLRLHRLVWAPRLGRRASWRTQADSAQIWDPSLDPANVLGTVVGVDGDGPRRPRPFHALRLLARGLRSQAAGRALSWRRA